MQKEKKREKKSFWIIDWLIWKKIKMHAECIYTSMYKK